VPPPLTGLIDPVLAERWVTCFIMVTTTVIGTPHLV
jgi:hypothetical protein